MTDYRQYKNRLNMPLDINKASVKIFYPNGESEIKSFNDVSKQALKENNLKLCADLFKNGFARLGQIDFYLK